MEPRPPSHSHSVLTRWMGIQEANMAGNVHGGAIMRMCDDNRLAERAQITAERGGQADSMF